MAFDEEEELKGLWLAQCKLVLLNGLYHFRKAVKSLVADE